MLHPAEIVARLRANHLPMLVEEDADLLAARMCGYRPAEIAAETFQAERTVRAHLDRLLDLICGPAGIKRDIGVATLWAWLHADCCAPAVFRHLGFVPQLPPLEPPAEGAEA